MAKAAATTTTTAKPKKAATSSSHASYKDMIKDAVLSLKERNGSSRQAIKKYVLANNSINVTSTKTFDSQFNRALKAGVENGDFTQPKGPSGPVKLAKKEAKPAAAKPTQKKSATATSTPSKKEAAPKKETAASKKETATTTAKKPAAAKKEAPAAKSKPAAKAKPAATKAKKEPLKPAVTQKETVLNTTKSGRVTKTTANPTTSRRAKAAPKKAQPKKGAAAAGGGEDAQAGESE